METKHTPTPWRVVNGSLIKDELMPFDRDERDTALIATTAGSATDALAAANSAFIVRACNSHERLVSACDRALRHFETIRGDKEDTPLMADLRRALRNALGGGQ